jgi:hypothetical protein
MTQSLLGDLAGAGTRLLGIARLAAMLRWKASSSPRTPFRCLSSPTAIRR